MLGILMLIAVAFSFTFVQGRTIEGRLDAEVFDDLSEIENDLKKLIYDEPLREGPETTTRTTDAPEEATESSETTTGAPEETTGAPKITSEAPEETTEAPELTTDALEETTESPELTTGAPEETTGAPKETTKAPEITTGAPEETTKAPEETTGAPKETTKAPEETTGAPKITTEDPELTTEAPEETTEAPELTTEAQEETTESPKITTEAPELTTDAPEETTESPEITTEAPKVPTTESEKPTTMPDSLCGFHANGQAIDVYEHPSCCVKFKCWGDVVGSCPAGTYYHEKKCVQDSTVCGQRPSLCGDVQKTTAVPVTGSSSRTPKAGPLCGSRKNGRPKAVYEDPFCCTKFKCWGNNAGSCPEGTYYHEKKCVQDSTICGQRPVSCSTPTIPPAPSALPSTTEAPCNSPCSSITFRLSRRRSGQYDFELNGDVCKKLQVVFKNANPPTDMRTAQGRSELTGNVFTVDLYKYVMERDQKQIKFEGHYNQNKRGKPGVMKVINGANECPIKKIREGRRGDDIDEVEFDEKVTSSDDMYTQVREIEREISALTSDVNN